MTDFFVSVFLLYGLLHIGVAQGFRCDHLVWFKWGAVTLCYLFFRRFKKPRVVLYSIVLYGLFQSVIAIGQSLSFSQSAHRFFSITGTIGNPGPLGGFLAIAIVCCIGLLRAKPMQGRISCSFYRIVLGLAACIMFVGLLLSDSRAAFLSISVGLVTIGGDRILKLFSKHKFAIFVTFSVLIIVLCCFLYLYRPASADARRLIWRVSADMIAEKPLFGHGVGAFDREYMLYQAAYFERNPQSSLVMVADNVAYPYNELIHVWIELGAIGVCLLLSIFISVFTFRPPSDRINRSLKAGLTTFIVFSLFSYPVEIIELLLVPAAFLGALSSKSVYILPVRHWMKFAGTGLLAGLIFLSVSGISVFRKIFGEVNQLAISGVPIPAPYCDRYFSVFKHNADFNMSYLPILCQLPCQPENWQKINSIFPSSETFCRLGEACESYGQDKRAEQVYRKAAQMVPTRVLPNYRLWKLYVKRDDCEQARTMAQKILTQPVKVENTFTLQVKGEMRRYLKN